MPLLWSAWCIHCKDVDTAVHVLICSWCQGVPMKRLFTHVINFVGVVQFIQTNNKSKNCYLINYTDVSSLLQIPHTVLMKDISTSQEHPNKSATIPSLPTHKRGVQLSSAALQMR